MAPHSQGVSVFVCVVPDKHTDVEVLKRDVPLTIPSGY